MKIKSCVSTLSLILLAIFSAFAAGEVDPTFTSTATNSGNSNVNVIEQQPDGKILVGGFFNVINGKPRYGLVRLNLDGSIDNSFTPPDFIHGAGPGGVIYAIRFQSDGKIIVGGQFEGTGTSYQPGGIRRLNTDGTLDTTFTSTTVNGINGADWVVDLEVLPDNKILIAGSFWTATSGQPVGLIRVNADGTPDASFTTMGPVVNRIALQPDGKIVVASGLGIPNPSTITRRNANGTPDPTFSQAFANGTVYDLEIFSNGAIMAAGAFGQVNGFFQGGISKINSDGSLDLSFNQNNGGALGTIYSLSERPGGKTLISGNFTQFNSTSRKNVAQLNTDGTLDTTFQLPTIFLDYFYEAKILADGTTLIGTVSANFTPALFKLNVNGTLNTAFNPILSRSGVVREVLPLPDGKLLFCGEFDNALSTPRASLARANTDGSIDTSFVPYFNTAGRQSLYALALQPDGKILIGGAFPQTIRRLNADGSEDTAFSSNLLLTSGTVQEIAVLPDGKIMVSGNLSFGGGVGLRRLSRLNANGSYDTSFNVSPSDTVAYKILPQADGKILVAGSFTQIAGQTRGRIARLNADGSADTSFNPPGGANGTVYDIDLQTDGKIVLAGEFTGLNGSLTRKYVGRLNSDGSLDTGFVQTADQPIQAIAVDPNGKILIGGGMSLVGTTPKKAIARLNADGSVDTTFTADADAIARDIALQSDGKILVGGEFIRINGVNAVRIARLNGGSPLAPQAKRFDFDGDGKADIAVYRSSNNTWYIFKSGNGQLEFHNFGLGGDILTPADFDGDQKFDLSIFRPSTGFTWFREVTTGNYNGTQFGANQDIPVHSDYTGDGKADYVVFRPSNGTWYRYDRINNQTSIIQFGSNGDIPVIADFDGDGKTDLAVFRPSTGDWYWMNSSNGQFFGYHFGATGDLTVPADYDGDGKTDLAVYRPSDGGWYRILSGNGQFASTQFGISTDKPIPADYDGDGKADIGVFRQGLWIILNSQSGSITGFQFGVPSDDPIPNAYVR